MFIFLKAPARINLPQPSPGRTAFQGGDGMSGCLSLPFPHSLLLRNHFPKFNLETLSETRCEVLVGGGEGRPEVTEAGAGLSQGPGQRTGPENGPGS